MSSSYICPKVPAMSWPMVENLADGTRVLLRLDETSIMRPKACFWLFEGGIRKLGIEYNVKELDYGEEGHYDSQGKELSLSPETYDGLYNDKCRARFTFAHELGHSQLHGKFIRSVVQGRSSCITLKRSQIPAYEDPECQANVFASEFLMPRRLFIEYMKQGFSVNELAAKFMVSRQAAEIRYQTLKKQASSGNY